MDSFRRSAELKSLSDDDGGGDGNDDGGDGNGDERQKANYRTEAGVTASRGVDIKVTDPKAAKQLLRQTDGRESAIALVLWALR